MIQYVIRAVATLRSRSKKCLHRALQTRKKLQQIVARIDKLSVSVLNCSDGRD